MRKHEHYLNCLEMFFVKLKIEPVLDLTHSLDLMHCDLLSSKRKESLNILIKARMLK